MRPTFAAGGGGEPIEYLEFKTQRPLGGVGDFSFKFAKLGGGEAHLSGECLAMNKSGIKGRAD